MQILVVVANIQMRALKTEVAVMLNNMILIFTFGDTMIVCGLWWMIINQNTKLKVYCKSHDDTVLQLTSYSYIFT